MEQVVGHLIDGPAHGAILPTMSTVTTSRIDQRFWFALVVVVMTIAVPGWIYLNYELGRRQQLCNTGLSYIFTRSDFDTNTTILLNILRIIETYCQYKLL